MQQLFNTEPFTKINKRDYLLIIPPVEDIALRITYLKLKAWELIGDYPSLHSIAHITVNYDPNIQDLIFEEKLTYYKRKLPCIDAFEVTVCGFGNFKHHENSYTIFAKVELSPVMEKAFSNLNRTFSKGVVKTPHITIAKTISKEKFDILWKHFENLQFECSFYADKIKVLETPTRKFHSLPMRFKTEIGLLTAQ